jgi:hypothetical protein
VRVVLRIDVTDEQRAAVRRSEGRSGLATRFEIASIVEMLIQQELAERVATYRRGK